MIASESENRRDRVTQRRNGKKMIKGKKKKKKKKKETGPWIQDQCRVLQVRAHGMETVHCTGFEKRWKMPHRTNWVLVEP